MYSCRSHGNYHPLIRSSTDVERFGFDPVCPECKKPGNPAPTPEETSLDCNSIYALTKKFQEESAICIAKLYEFPAVLLKYFNVFGPRQSLSNPYTGVSAIFTSAIKQGKRPLVYEDGLQSRDFISIHDVVEANVLAMKSQKADYQTFNVGSGRLITIKYLAEEISHLFGKQVELEIRGKFRKGDIRHCVADYSKIDKTLGWQPKVSFEEGLEEIITWSKTQESSSDTGRAQRELELRRLV